MICSVEESEVNQHMLLVIAIEADVKKAICPLLKEVHVLRNEVKMLKESNCDLIHLLFENDKDTGVIEIVALLDLFRQSEQKFEEIIKHSIIFML